MIISQKYSKEKPGFSRIAVSASVPVTSGKNAIHSFTDVDISRPRRLIRGYGQQFGENLSCTAYVVTCLANIIKKNPQVNSFIKGGYIIFLSNTTISEMVESEINGILVPEPLGIEN